MPGLKLFRLLVAGLILGAAAARAQQAATSPAPSEPASAPSAPANPVPSPGAAGVAPGTGPTPGEPGWTTNLFTSAQPNLLGGLYGLRPHLADYGISLGLQETSEVFGNATGGIHTGAAYNGLTLMSLGLDTSKRLGWEGGIFNVSAFQIHGRFFPADNLPALQLTSGIQAQRSTRLWELWFQQSFFGGKMDVKIGQQSLDQEFILSAGSGAFINAAAGWPVLPTVDMYAGGPAFPLSSLGARVRGQPMQDVTVLAGVFDDNPPGGPFFDDSAVRGAAQSGTSFNFNTGAMLIAEVQYALNAPPEGQSNGPGLPGTYKLGAWYDTGKFFDQRYDTNYNLLGGPNSNGVRLTRRHNYTIYGVADQMVWRPAQDSPQAVNVFARVIGAPGDRNLVNFAFNTGVVLKAPFEGRDNDTFGVEFGYAKVSPNAIKFDQDTNQFSGPYPIRSSESFIEATYQVQIAPWWSMQPNVQYVFTPLGGVRNPLQPTQRIGNAAVFGLRTNIVF